MKAETAERCIMECQRFIKAWENCVRRNKKLSADYGETENRYIHRDFLANDYNICKERAALRRASLDLSNALADLRQGR